MTPIPIVIPTPIVTGGGALTPGSYAAILAVSALLVCFLMNVIEGGADAAVYREKRPVKTRIGKWCRFRLFYNIGYWLGEVVDEQET